MVRQPTNVDVRADLPSLELEVVNSAGQRISDYSGQVRVQLISDGMGTLGGSAVAAIRAGVASFTGLSVDRPAASNRLAFAADGIPRAESQSFRVRARPTLRTFGLLIFPSAWEELCEGEPRLAGRAFTHASAASLGAGVEGQTRVEYAIARADGSNQFWSLLSAHGSYLRVQEADGRYRLDFSDPTTRQTVLSYLKSVKAEAVFFDSVDKPASWGGDTPGLSTMIDEVLAAGMGPRVFISGGGWQGQIGLDPAHPWRRDSRIVVLDEGLDVASYVSLGKQATTPYLLGADFTRFTSSLDALEHEVGCVAAALVLEAEFGVEAWVSTTVSPSQRVFQGTREIQAYDYGSVVSGPTQTKDFAQIQASSSVTFHRRERAIVVHNTAGVDVTLTVPSTSSEFDAKGALVSATTSRTLPPDGCWLWLE